MEDFMNTREHGILQVLKREFPNISFKVQAPMGSWKWSVSVPASVKGTELEQKVFRFLEKNFDYGHKRKN